GQPGHGKEAWAQEHTLRLDDNARVPGNTNAVVAGRAVDDDVVGLAIVTEADVHLGDAGAAQVVDGDGVGPGAAAEIDPLDAGRVEGSKEVAEQNPIPVGRECDIADCRDHEGVGTGTAVDGIKSDV